MHIAGFLNHLLEASVGAAILVPLLLLLRRFGRARVGSRAVYLAWLLVAARLLLPISLPNPLLETDPVPAMRTAYEARIEPVQALAQTDAGTAPAYAGQLPNEPSRDGAQQPVRVQDVQTANLPAGQPVSEPVPPPAPLSAPVWGALQWTRAIFVAYLLGAAMTAAYMFVVNVRFRRRVRRAEAGAFDPLARAQYDALCAQLGVKPLPVVLCDPLPGACLVGVARSRIALPLSLRGEDLRLTLLHELSHAKAYDGLWGLIRSACCVLFWFHPLVWLGAHLSRLDGEMACDERVTDKLSQIERIAYAEMLVRAAARRGAPSLGVLATGMSMNGSRMKARVRSIVQSRAVRRSALAAAALVGAAMLTLTFATAEVERPMEEDMPAEPQAQVLAATLDADVIDALQLPVERVTLEPGVCDVIWNLPQGEWEVALLDAGRRELDRQKASGEARTRLSRPQGAAAPWTLELTDPQGAEIRFALDADGAIAGYDAGIAPESAQRTERLFVEGSGEDWYDADESHAERKLSQIDGRFYTRESEQAREALMYRVLGATPLRGSEYAEVHADAGHVRKYLVRRQRGDAQESWRIRMQMEPPRILSLEREVMDPAYLDVSAYVVPLTQAETIDAVRAFLTDAAGWTQADIAAPMEGSAQISDGLRTDVYGETESGARDLWYAAYHQSGRWISQYWRLDVLENAPSRRRLTEKERAWAEGEAERFVQAHYRDHKSTFVSATAEADVQVYGDEEVVRVAVMYGNDIHPQYDRLSIRLNPPAVLALERMEAPAPVAVDWPPSEVPPQTLDALGLPIAGLRLTSQACEMDWLEPVSGWQVRWYDAQGEQITSQRGAGVRRHTTPYGRPAPWTLELSYEGHSPLHTLALDEDGKILTYAYGGYPDDVVLGTEQAMPPRRTFDAEREVEARIRQILPNVDGGATGAAYAEIRRDAGRIRKYVQTEQGETYYFTAATDGSRILSMRWGNGEPQHYMDLTIAPTREEATAHAQAILTDIAGWLPEEVYTPSLTVVDRPSRGERYSYEFYGASQTDAKDIWYGIYIGGQRHLNAFWRMDVLEDAPVQRPLTEAERAELAQYACAFVEETRGMYPISGLQAAVEDQAQVYSFGEVAHVNVDDAEGGRDVLYIRLAPRSVLYQNRADVASAASGDAQPKVAQKEAEGEWKQAQALLDAVGNEERIYTSKDRGSDTRFQGGEGKERFTLVMGEDGSLISYALKRLEDEPIGTQKLPEAQRRSLEAHARDVGEQLLGQAQVSVGPEASAYKWGDAAKARVWDAQSGQGYDLVLGLEPMRVLGVERRAPAAE